MAGATSLTPPSPGLSATLFPNKSVEPSSPKGPENIKITTAYSSLLYHARPPTYLPNLGRVVKICQNDPPNQTEIIHPKNDTFPLSGALCPDITTEDGSFLFLVNRLVALRAI